MEPMTLGSPLGSPNSPGGNQYLPPFLLGEQSTPNGLISSTPIQRRISTDVNGIGAHPMTSSRSPRNLPEYELRSVNLLQSAEKQGGPPTQGLFESLSVSKTSPPRTETTPLTIHPRTPMNTTAVSWASPLCRQTPTSSSVQNSLYPSMNASSSFIFQNQFETDTTPSCWVTVFGFPPAANSFIMSEFSQFGDVLEYRISNHGNWIHICYGTPQQAMKALSKNGKVFGKYIMVGVKSCREEDIAQLQSQKENIPLTPGFTSSPSFHFTSTGRSSGYNHDNTRHLGEIQPLSFFSRHASTSVIPIAGTPKKNSSVVSKAMDLLFGW